eukprot:SAG31_NODE_10676_length_1111_cov_1.457510_1_plen_35_part_10
MPLPLTLYRSVHRAALLTKQRDQLVLLLVDETAQG